MEPYIYYIKIGEIPKGQEKRWIRKVAQYTMMNEKLFRKEYSRPLRKCVTSDQVAYVIQEIHNEVYEYHSGTRTMTVRIL